MKKTEKINFDIGDILNYLPHRYPFLLVDKVVNIVPKISGVGIKCVSMNESFFQGHFPGNPIMPGVLMLEAMAQTCIMIYKPFLEKDDVLFAFSGIDKVKFRRKVLPGDVLHIDMKTIACKGPLIKCQGTITVDNDIAVEAVLSAFMINEEKKAKS